MRFGRGHRPCGSTDRGNSGTTRLQSVDRGAKPHEDKHTSDVLSMETVPVHAHLNRAVTTTSDKP